MSIHEFIQHLDAKKISLIIASIVGVSTIFEKIFKVKFIANWIMKLLRNIRNFLIAPFTILHEIKEMKEQQALNSSTLSSLENEIKYNGGKYTLKTVIKEIKGIVDQLALNHELTSQSLRASLYVSPDPIFITDKDGKLTFINAAWARMVECAAPQEMMGFGWLRVIPEDQRQALLEQGKLLRESPIPYSGEITYLNWRTGDKIQTYCRSTVVLDHEGKLIETIGALEVIK